jgi:isoquinoline 1-oxidoreductase beta subunit
MGKVVRGLSHRFILSTAAASGGLAIGLRLARFKNVEIHNWITVAGDNTVTIRITQMEMGQGTMTSMAQLLAEELEVDWSKIPTEFISTATHLNRGGIYGRITTNASEGVSQSQALLRTCGAQIRMMFLRAAADRFGVPETELLAKLMAAWQPMQPMFPYLIQLRSNSRNLKIGST